MRSILALIYALTDSVLGTVFLFGIIGVTGNHPAPLFGLIFIPVLVLAQYSMQAETGNFRTDIRGMMWQAGEPYILSLIPVLLNEAGYIPTLVSLVVASLAARIVGHAIAIVAAPFHVSAAKRNLWAYAKKIIFPAALIFLPTTWAVFLGILWVFQQSEVTGTVGLVIFLITFLRRAVHHAKTLGPKDFYRIQNA